MTWSGRRIPRVALPLLCWALAAGLTYLHLTAGPATQDIVVRWAAETDDIARLQAEIALGLGAGEATDDGVRVYQPREYSRDAMRRIVQHPLVADTGHIDRVAFRIEIDRPDLPTPLRRVLESNLGPVLSGLFFLAGGFLAWRARHDVRTLCVDLSGRRSVGLAVSLGALAAGFPFTGGFGLAVDENVHYGQIEQFARGDWSLQPYLTVIPGFHALLAVLASATGEVSEARVRVLVVLLAAVTILVFDGLSHAVRRDAGPVRTLQFAFLPILSPQFFLIYTDVVSLLFVLLMMWATVRRRLGWAGLAGLAACLVRQNNVVWLGFAVVWSYVNEYGWTWRPLGERLIRYWSFGLTALAFVGFVVFNGGEVALGQDVGSHPLGEPHFTNVFLLLFLTAFFFMPSWWVMQRGMLLSLRDWRVWAAGLVLLLLFWVGFINDHPHNTERADYFLFNRLLVWATASTVSKVIFLLPVVVAVLGLGLTRLQPRWWLLYPVTSLYLLPEWLVAPRYYVVPLALFLVGRDASSKGAEWTQAALMAALSLAAFVFVQGRLGWF